ncbi:MAG: hypothetical protein R3C15_07665 [Thermoleophilia bacterium]
MPTSPSIRVLASLGLAAALALPAAARADAVPEIDVEAPTSALQGETVGFAVTLRNAGDLVGLTLFVDVITPEGGPDADEATDDGLELRGIAFPDTLTRGGDYPADRAGRIVHPFLRSDSGPSVIEAEPGDVLWSAVDGYRAGLNPGEAVRLPGSVRVGREATVGRTLVLRVRAGFGSASPFTPNAGSSLTEFARIELVPAAYDLEAGIASLASQLVIWSPAAAVPFSGSDVERLQRTLRASSTPVFLAVLPSSSGQPDAVLQRIRNGVGLDGTYAAVVGDQLVASSTLVPDDDLEAIRAGALDTGPGLADAPSTVLEAFVRDVERYAENPPAPPPPPEQPSPAPAPVERPSAPFSSEAPEAAPAGDGGSGPPIGLFAIPGVLVLAGLATVGSKQLRRRRGERQLADEVRDEAQGDLQALGEDIAALDLDVEMPTATPEAKADYAHAVTRYDEANRLLGRARTATELRRVAEAIADGRYAMASAKARLAGHEPPALRPPCFFDPRHGPSVIDVTWAPEGGTTRAVPVCQACATHVSDGAAPEVRTVRVGDAEVPYWASPALGYYGGSFGKELLATLAVLQAASQASTATTIVRSGTQRRRAR